MHIALAIPVACWSIPNGMDRHAEEMMCTRSS
jgi:hypothetical protein